MPLVTKLLFAAIGIGLTFPLWLPIWQGSAMRQRRYERRRNRVNKPVSTQRYNRLWVVDRDPE